MRSLLDGISSRLDESRELSRYMTGLLIFLGLLGTFWGLLKTVSSVSDVIGGMTLGNGDMNLMFEQLKSGLTKPLAGMGTAFSASMYGLAGARKPIGRNGELSDLQQFLVADAGVAQGDFRLFAARLEGDGHYGLDAFGRFGHPRILDAARAFDGNEAAVMWPCSSFVAHREIEKPVHDRVQNYALGAAPRASGTLRVHPDVEYLLGRRGNCTADGNIREFHL